MRMYEHLAEWGGKPVRDTDDDRLDLRNCSLRLRAGYGAESPLRDQLAGVLESDHADQLTGLVIGAWWDLDYQTPTALIDALVVAADQLPSLRHLFFGDILSEECEISWIQQGDLSPLWAAFPQLVTLGIRGGAGLSLGRMQLNHLEELTIECGGLPRSVLNEIAAASLPALERLEIFLGEERNGWDGTIADVQPLLSGDRFPRLKHLGLRDSEIADEVAAAVATSPLLARLESLDVSLGTLSDKGGEALLAAPAIRALRRIDLHHHYMSADLIERWCQLAKAERIALDISEDQDNEEGDRYVAVGE